MVNKNKSYNITLELLEEYQEHSLINAKELLSESHLLFQNKKYARSYFLACASIEETGKAYIAFNAKGRTLDNVKETLKNKFERHSDKLISALTCWLISFEKHDIEKNVMEIVDISIHLQYGRELSMYVDFKENKTLSIPSQVVQKQNAVGCIEIADKCFSTTNEYTLNNKPKQTCNLDDKYFNLSPSKISEITNTENFWHYFLDQAQNKSDLANITKYIVRYRESYYCKNKQFLIQDS